MKCADIGRTTDGETRETGEQHGHHAPGTVHMSGQDVERSFTREQNRELAQEAIHAQLGTYVMYFLPPLGS